MGYLQILVLAVVQGVTEFLPISSDGHLVVVASLFEAWTGEALKDTLAVEIVLHAGTLLAVLVLFWDRLWALLGADRRVIGLLFVGTLPAVVVGPALKIYGKHLLESPLAAGLGLIITGAVLIWGGRNSRGDRPYQELSFTAAFVIGCFQAAAILPGVSRSGLTIASGLALAGLRRDAAANFSFLLAVPVIGGAVTLQTVELIKDGSEATPTMALIVGILVSFAVGLVTLAWLLKWLRVGRLQNFAWWCIPLGAVVTIWQLIGR